MAASAILLLVVASESPIIRPQVTVAFTDADEAAGAGGLVPVHLDAPGGAE